MVLDLTYGSVQKIPHDSLGLRRYCSTCVSHHLTTEQMAAHVESDQEWLE